MSGTRSSSPVGTSISVVGMMAAKLDSTPLTKQKVHQRLVASCLQEEYQQHEEV